VPAGNWQSLQVDSLQRLGVVAQACRSSVPSLLGDDHSTGLQHGSKTMQRHILLPSLVQELLKIKLVLLLHPSDRLDSQKHGKLTVIEVNSNIIQVISLRGVSASATSSCIR
jgi:hypothetical protein